MQIPFAILKSSGGSKAVALLALLAGLYIVTKLQAQPPPSSLPPRR